MSVVDELTFVAFLQALASDRSESVRVSQADQLSPSEPDPLGWENGTIEGFLESAAAWALDNQHGEAGTGPEANPWRRSATILLAGKSYE